MKRLVWIVALVAVALLGGWWTLGARGADDSPEWATVERADLVIAVDLTGTLQAVESEVIGPPQLMNTWNYRIARMADEGSEVQAGDVVLAFDTTELSQRLDREKAERDAAAKRVEKAEHELAVSTRGHEMRLEEARGKLRKAELKVDVPPELEKAATLAKQQLDLELARTETEFLVARLASARRSAEASLAVLRSQLGEATREVEARLAEIEQMSRRAPRAGTVIYVKHRWSGEKKKVGDSCWRGESVIELPDLTRMRGSGQVHEADAGRIVEDQPVRLKLDAHPDVEFGGTVASIWKTVERESWSSPLKVVRLDIDLERTDPKKMRPGMRFRGEIEIERVSDAVIVGLDAVSPGPDGPVVLRRSLFGAETVSVQLGRRNRDSVEVLDGLAPGDRVRRAGATG